MTVNSSQQNCEKISLGIEIDIVLEFRSWHAIHRISIFGRFLQLGIRQFVERGWKKKKNSPDSEIEMELSLDHVM